MENISYERRIYESINEKSLSWDISQKSKEFVQERVNHCSKIYAIYFDIIISIESFNNIF